MPYYSEATAANAALVANQTVNLVKDVNETDRYGRLLRYVYLADGTFVNQELVRQGYAQLATFPPDVAMEAQIRTAQQEAVAAGVGLWEQAPDPVVEVVPVVDQLAANPSIPLQPPIRMGICVQALASTEYEVIGSVTPGQSLQIVYKNPAGDWYQLGNGAWIAAFLVQGVRADVPIALAIT